MRVALIGPVPPSLGGATPGGVATHQAYLAAGLVSAGIDASLLATNTAAATSDWHADPTALAFPMYCMPRPGEDRRAYLAAVGASHMIRYLSHVALGQRNTSRRETLVNLLAYRRFLQHIGPGLVHVQHPLERFAYVRTVQRLEGWRLPVVVTAHSLFGEHTEETITRVMAPNLREARAVIAVSEHVAEQAIQLGVQPAALHVIRSGVDMEQFRPRDRARARAAIGIAQDTPLILFVGNLEPRKQVDVLLRAMVRVRQVAANAVLLVIGSGENAGVQDQTARLVRLSRDLELVDSVRFLGRVGDAELENYYAAADVFALPSNSEAQGLVALEAMASGLPVVASAVGGLLGTIEDGLTGFLVQPGDVAALAERLVDVVQDAARQQIIGAAARKAVEVDFSWARAIEATVGVYREVLE